jgi:dipeptidyl aminopeptidase/acylaminoacyl peptidase
MRSLLFFLAPLLLHAQGTRADYQRAARHVLYADPPASDGQIDLNWIGKEDRFWYSVQTPEATTYYIVDAKALGRKPAFDHARLAAALSKAVGRTLPANRLRLSGLQFSDKDQRLSLTLAAGRRYTCSLAGYECTPAPPALEVKSPNGEWTATLQNHNLYLKSSVTGETLQLTSDGAARRDYARSLPTLSQMAGEGRQDVPMPPAVFWSPDSKRLLTYRLDSRSAGTFTALQTVPPIGVRPRAFTWVYQLPGEVGIPRAEPIVFEIPTGRRIPVAAEPLPLFFYGGPGFQWLPDSRRVLYLEFERGYQAAHLREIDAGTGRVRVLIEERSKTMVHSSLAWEVLPKREEVLWTSERDGWRHVYRYDLQTGALKNQVTSGAWTVRQIFPQALQNGAAGRLYFAAGGREPGRDPYFRRIYSVAPDGTGLRLLSPDDADHQAAFSPSGEFFADVSSTPETPGLAVLRSAADGRPLMDIEKGDVEALRNTGWRPPEHFRALAADGQTPIYGALWRPSHFDPARKYPAVELIYTGPQGFSAPKRLAVLSQQQSLAELGFIVMTVDGRGMAYRSKAFHDFAWKNLGAKEGLEDHIAAWKQLAAKYPYIDLTRAGVVGHSAGGYDSTHALITHPEFYKAAVSSAGNHDHRMDKLWWNEQWMGFPLGPHYREQSNVTHASKLQGKLLLIHGELDDNVHPAATMQLADALIKAGKDFDLLIVPGATHNLSRNPYVIRRTWDFLVRHLHGLEPPRDFHLPPPPG